MFDKKKIQLNHIRASKDLNKKAKKFFLNIANILIERACLNKKSSYEILELGARTNSLNVQLKKKKKKFNFVSNNNIK